MNPTRERNKRIYEYTLSNPGSSFDDVASRFKTTPRQVENIIAAERARQTPKRNRQPPAIRDRRDVVERISGRVRDRIAAMKAVGDGPEQIQWRLKMELDVSVTLEFIQSV